MVDLLAAKLTGDGGPRAVTPGIVLRAWSQMGSAEESGGEDIGMLTAASVGAGLLLSGGVVQEQNRVIINASLLTVPDGDVRGQTSVGGPLDSLTMLIDRLTAELLSLQAGQEVDRLAALTSTSLPALRAYLEGQAASRGGRYDEARDHLHKALDLDSTFALAGLTAGLNWAGSPRGRRLAWQHRDRLSQRDRVVLTALVGENPSARRSMAEQLAAWEVGVRLASDRPRAWIELGETLFHWGRVMGLNAPMERAAAAFNRALGLDSSLATPLQHMMEIATLSGDTAEVRRLGTLYVALDPPAEHDGYVRWHMAHILGDSMALREVQMGLDTLADRSLWEIFQIGQWFGFGIEDVVRAQEIRLRNAGSASERRAWLYYGATLAHNRGRPSEAFANRQAAHEVAPINREIDRRFILDALYWNGDSATAARAVQERVPLADAALSGTAEARAEQLSDICVVEQWRLWHGQAASAPEAVRKLRNFSTTNDASERVAAAHYCAALLEGMAAVVGDRPDARETVARLDSLWQTGVAGLPTWLNKLSPLVISRLYEAIGDVPGALAAIRRREFYLRHAQYFASYVREEGRLAALVGDREGAIRAYQHYLALRDDPEPSVQPEVDAVRAELATLVGETTR